MSSSTNASLDWRIPCATIKANLHRLQGPARVEACQLLDLLIPRQERQKLQNSLYYFVKAAWPHIESSIYIDNWHIKAICDHLQAITAGTINKLLINIPPGCSKSLLVSVFWPCWEWTINPSIRWFYSSYDQRLSTRDSVKCRVLINSSWYRQYWGDGFTLMHDQNQKTYFETSKGGYRLATSIAGHGTGEHPDRIVVDDPHNVEQAESETERQAVLNWWDLTMSTRGVSRSARRVIIMQRLHHDDLAGHVISKGDYCHICLPMRYETERMPITPLGWMDPRQVDGELLCPSQFNELMVAEQERNLGAYGTAGQLQQNPTPRTGGMFHEDWFNQRVKAAPYAAQRIRYWDRAATEGAGCWTAGVLIAKSPDGNYYIENVVRGQWEPDRRNQMLVATAQRDRSRYGPNHEPIIWVEREGGSSGRDAWKGVARALAGFPVREDTVTGKKEIRAEPWACQLASKNVYIVDDGTWDINAYVLEHCQFPLGKYLDQVDASSGGFNLLTGYKSAPRLLSFGLSQHKQPGLRIILCDEAGLAGLVLEQRSVLISIRDPLMAAAVMSEPIITLATHQDADHQVNGFHHPITEAPPHALKQLLESITLTFADLQPSEHQQHIDAPVAPYNRLPLEIGMQPADGKRIWQLLTKKRSSSPEIIIIQDNGHDDRRALSIALAINDVLGLKREATLYRLHDDDWQAKTADVPPNGHIYSQTRVARGLVL